LKTEQPTNDKGSTTNSNLLANAKGISTAEVNIVIEWQTNKPHVACNRQCCVQNKSVQTPAVTTPRDTQRAFLLC